MKKFISLLALLVFALILGAKGLDPPRDHTTYGYEIVISDADEITAVADAIAFQETILVADEGPWQPPGMLYEFGITTKSIYPYTLTGELQQNSLILLSDNKDRLSDLQNINNYRQHTCSKTFSYPEALFWNHTLFRCDRARHV